MCWWSLVIAGAIGAIFGGAPGALLALVAVLIFDYQRNRGQIPSGDMEQAWGLEPDDATLFEATFLMMGHIAKADGRVSEVEIAVAKSVMDELGLSAEGKRWAIRLFDKGKRQDIALERMLARLRHACASKPAVIPTFIQRQLMVAYADGQPDPGQEKVIWLIADGLGVDHAQVERLAEIAGSKVRASRPVKVVNGGDPYAVLGLDRGATDDEVRQAYRRLVSKYHPDKVVGQGASDSDVDAAAERTRAVRQAYEAIVAARAAS